jgi:hypothetical protein
LAEEAVARGTELLLEMAVVAVEKLKEEAH